MLNSRLSVQDTVRQSVLIHPDWTPRQHVEYLDAEWWDGNWRDRVWARAVRAGFPTPDAQVRAWAVEAGAPSPETVAGFRRRLGFSRARGGEVGCDYCGAYVNGDAVDMETHRAACLTGDPG